MKLFFRLIGMTCLLTAAILFALKQFGYLQTAAQSKADTTNYKQLYQSLLEKTANNIDETSTSAAQQVTTAQSGVTTTNTTTVSSSTTTASSAENSFAITDDDTSFSIARRLKELNVIDDAEKFNDYLLTNNLGTQLQNGNHTVKKGLSFEELAKILTTYTGN